MRRARRSWPHNMANDGTKPNSIAIVASIKSTPGLALMEQPLLKNLVPSLVSTITRGEHSRHRAGIGLYLYAKEDDDFFIEHTRELRRLLAARLGFMLPPRILYFPSPETGLNGAMLYAYADGFQYFHRTFEDVKYARPAWLGDAVRALSLGHTSYAQPMVERQVRSVERAARPSVVARRHLDIFESYHPAQLHGAGAIDAWFGGAYARERDVKPVRAATASQLVTPLIQCARYVIAAYSEANHSAEPWSRATCIARGGGVAAKGSQLVRSSGDSGEICQNHWCAIRTKQPAPRKRLLDSAAQP